MTPPNTLIDAKALSALPRGACLIVDCRHDLTDVDAGRRAWAQAHLPGAVHAHVDRDLSDLSKKGLGRHPLPDAGVFAATLARWGWRPGLPVVAYDAMGGALAAARLWWMLRVMDQPAMVLDGGLQAWIAAGLPLESQAVAATPAPVAPLRWPADRVLDVEQVLQQRTRADVLLLDARATPRYRGDVEPLDSKAGHIPGARNRPFASNLGDDGRFKPIDDLREEWLDLLAGGDPACVVHMCGSGVTACHNLLAMEHAGLPGSRLFAPSWSGWISDPERPVATGAAAG